jgi:spore coat protein CotH
MLLVMGAAGQDPPAKQDPPGKQEARKDDNAKTAPAKMFGGPGQPERKLVKQFDKDGDGKLNQEERKAARAFIKANPGGRRGPGGFGPMGGGPGGMVATPLTEALDSDKDGKLTKDEVTAGVKKLFAEADKDKKGSLEDLQLAGAIDRIFPRPPGAPAASPGKDGPPGKESGPPEKAARPPEKGGPPDKMFGPVAGGIGFRMGRPGSALAVEIFRRADKTKKGKVTLDDLTAAAEVLFTESDQNKDAKLDATELIAGLGKLFPAPTFGGPSGQRNQGPAKPGPKIAKSDAKHHLDVALYEPSVLRTIFLDFENKDWEAEMADFYHTDVEVPATLTVDGKTYPGVGIHFRGASSYFSIREGYKRSLNVSVDFSDPQLRLYGYKTLNLLNCNDDPSFLHSVLFSHIARQYIPAPKANLVKVVINGESWGLYANLQQFNKDFVEENYKSSKGARWKVKGSPGGGGGLDYLSDKVDDYKRRYELKTKDDDKDWQALMKLCRILSKTPAEELEEKLKPILDIDGVLWFLALDITLINNDGYWIRASDFSLYRDGKGKFHLIPHDMNESFGMPGGPGFVGGPGGGNRAGGKMPEGKVPERKAPEKGEQAQRPRGVELDPLTGLTDARKPLRSKLLAVPKYRAQYLRNVRTIAEKSLDWNKLGPVVKQYRDLIEKEVEADTRKLYTLASFKTVIGDAPPATPRPNEMSLKAFCEQRRTYLLHYSEPKKTTAQKE